LNRLAAFRKPVEWEAVHWVMGKGEKRRAKDMDEPVRELMDWGLLTPIEEKGEVSLLTVHSLVRDFCRDKCKDKWKQYLEDAADYYINQSTDIEPDQKTLNIVMEEIEAAELLMEAGEFEPAAEIIINVTPLLDRWGLGRLRESLYERIIPEVKKETQSVLIHNLGILLRLRGDYQAALHQYEKSLKIKEELGDLTGAASSLHQIGMIHQLRGDFPEALEQYEKSLKIEKKLGNRAGVAISLHEIGIIHHNCGEYPAALEQYEKSLKILEELGDWARVAGSLHNIGAIHHVRENYSAALEQYKKSLKIEEEIGDRAKMAASLHQIGIIHQERGDYPAALEQYEKSLKIKEELGDRAGVASSLHQIGMIHQEHKKYPEALEMYIKSLTIFAKLQSPDAKIAINNLIDLRAQWGAEHFDAAWVEKTGEGVPEFLKESGTVVQ
jgi:tetratricopeptide (TPR) repeat protein